MMNHPPSTPVYSFILVLQYAGQQGAGVNEVQSEMDIMPMMVVEPFLQNSVMGVHPQMKGEEQGVKFSDVFPHSPTGDLGDIAGWTKGCAREGCKGK